MHAQASVAKLTEVPALGARKRKPLCTSPLMGAHTCDADTLHVYGGYQTGRDGGVHSYEDLLVLCASVHSLHIINHCDMREAIATARGGWCIHGRPPLP